jgi:hypothetical protein
VATTIGWVGFTCTGAATLGAGGGFATGAAATVGLGAGVGLVTIGSGATGATLHALVRRRAAMPTMDNAVRRVCNAYSRKLG